MRFGTWLNANNLEIATTWQTLDANLLKPLDKATNRGNSWTYMLCSYTAPQVLGTAGGWKHSAGFFGTAVRRITLWVNLVLIGCRWMRDAFRPAQKFQRDIATIYAISLDELSNQNRRMYQPIKIAVW